MTLAHIFNIFCIAFTCYWLMVGISAVFSLGWTALAGVFLFLVFGSNVLVGLACLAKADFS